MNRVLREHCLFTCMTFPTIILSQETFARLITSCPKEDLRAMAREASTITLSDLFNTIGLDLNRENVIGYIKEGLSKYSNWFTYSYHLNKNEEMFHLRHHFGENWSLYVSELISTIFQNRLHIKPRIETVGHTITIRIPISEHM